MKRILVWGLSNNRAGTEAVISSYVKALDSNAYSFDFLCYDNLSNYAYLFPEDGCNRVFQIPIKIKHPFAHRKALKAFMEEHAQEYYAVWFNANDISNIDLLLSAEKHGIKHRILHSHNGSIPKKLVTRVFSQLNIKKMKRVVTQRWACSRVAGDFMFYGEPYEIIPNMVDAEKFSFNEEARNTIRVQYGWGSKYIVGTIGRISEQKNQLFLVELIPQLLARISNLKVVVIGEGPLEHPLVSKARKLDVEEYLQILPPQSNISEILSAFDCFALPSLYEGLSLAALEAQFNGLPCIMSDGISKETEIAKTTKFISLSEPQEWIDAICEADRRESSFLLENAQDFDAAHISEVAERMFELDED